MSILAQKLLNAKPSATIAMSQKAIDLRAAGRDIIGLAAGEADFDTPEAIREAGKSAIDEGKTRYLPVPGLPELREAISTKFKSENGLGYGASEIIVSTGGKQVIFNAFMATLDPGDEVLIPAPYWVSYPDMVTLCGGLPVAVETRAEDGFKLQPDELEAAITDNTKWLMLNSPNNPTGAVYSAAELRALADVLLRHPQVWILSDDIYESLCFDDIAFTTIAQVEPALLCRTLTVNGASKAYAMTGWRLGYGGGPSELVAAMAKVQGQSTTSASSITQWAGVEAFTGPQDYKDERCAEIAARRDLAFEALSGIEGLTCVRPEGAFYAFASCKSLLGAHHEKAGRIGTDTEFCLGLLEQEGVALVPGEAFGAPGYFRLSYSVDRVTIQRGCERIAHFCRDLTG